MFIEWNLIFDVSKLSVIFFGTPCITTQYFFGWKPLNRRQTRLNISLITRHKVCFMYIYGYLWVLNALFPCLGFVLFGWLFVPHVLHDLFHDIYYILLFISYTFVKGFLAITFELLLISSYTFMMCVNVFYITRNKISVGPDTKWEPQL